MRSQSNFAVSLNATKEERPFNHQPMTVATDQANASKQEPRSSRTCEAQDNMIAAEQPQADEKAMNEQSEDIEASLALRSNHANKQ